MPNRTRLIAACASALLLAPTAANAQTFNWSTGEWSAPAATKNSVRDRYVVAFPKSYAPKQIIVSFSDRRLYHVTARGRAVSYPIAVPRPESRWDGVERVSYKRVNPTWTPTAKMRRENPKLPRVVRGGDPMNPMGSRAIYLGNTLYRIHGTDAPWTIGKNVSRGCIRMHNAHVEELYPHARTGMRVVSTWKRFRTRPIDRPTDQQPIDLFAAIFGAN